jgi:FAS-associated factor 2
MNLESLTERLEVVIRDNEAYIVAASAERAERNINAEIRQEQDAAFQATLRLDQERERQKLEAEEAKRHEEEAEKARIQADIDRKENIARQKIELASEIPDEPPVNEPTAVRIVIKLPEGQRLERRFHKSQSLKVDISSLLTLD